MGFWIYMLLMNMIMPVLMIVFGRWMWKYPPKTINALFGYRTSMSMKNQDIWNYAHDYCGRLWWRIGWILFPVSVVLMLPLIGRTTDTIGLWSGVIEGVQCTILIGSIFPVEKALKKTFDKNGNRLEE